MADILIFVAAKEDTTTKEITQQFGYASTIAEHYMQQLDTFSYIEVSDRNKNRKYHIII